MFKCVFAASKFLQDSSMMLCGQPMVSDNGDLYKIISRIEDNSKDFDKVELDSLPSTCNEAIGATKKKERDD